MAAIVNCPECGEEYLATTRECADCGVPLGAAAPPQPAPASELPPVAQLTCVRTAALGVVQALSDMLVEQGITHRIEALAPDDPDARRVRRPDASPYGVFVREQDVPAALEVDRAFMRQIIPDLPDDAEAPLAEGACPACGAAVASDAAECADCGLALVEA
jgi:predicted amidophosphoribosyltransferase